MLHKVMLVHYKEMPDSNNAPQWFMEDHYIVTVTTDDTIAIDAMEDLLNLARDNNLVKYVDRP